MVSVLSVVSVVSGRCSECVVSEVRTLNLDQLIMYHIHYLIDQVTEIFF